MFNRSPAVASLADWPRWMEISFIAIGWALVIAVALVSRALDPVPFSLHTIGVTLVEYGPWALLTPVIFYLARRVPPERDRWLGRVIIHLAVAVLLSTSAAGINRAGMNLLGPPPAPRSGPMMEPSRPPMPPGPRRRFGMDGRPAIFQFSYHAMIYAVILGIGFARAFALQSRVRKIEMAALAAESERIEAERARLSSRLSEARLQALRMQLNPHFLFNALNAVSALAGDDPTAVRRIVSRLSALLRRVLEADATREVKLREELVFLRDYLEIQRYRFDSPLDLHEEFSDEALDALVPDLILQPLLENAIEHGFARAPAGEGRIALAGYRENSADGSDMLVLQVRDNGPGQRREATDRPQGGTGVGLANTRERLDAHYGPAASLKLRPSAIGFEAEIRIPYHTSLDVN